MFKEPENPALWAGPPPPAIDSDTTSGLELGTLQGIVPFAATLDATQRAAGVAPKGSPRFETGKSIGQMLGGLGLMVLGGIGTGGGFAISLTQIGAAIGIPVAALSVGVTVAGMANAAAGWQGLLQSLSTGGNAGPPGVSAGPAAPKTGAKEMHHTIPREVRAPRSGKPGHLRPDVAEHPDVVGRPGLPNRWEIPKELHRSLHPKFNQRFIEEVKKLGEKYKPEDIVQIRDRLVDEFGINQYRPQK